MSGNGFSEALTNGGSWIGATLAAGIATEIFGLAILSVGTAGAGLFGAVAGYYVTAVGFPLTSDGPFDEPDEYSPVDDGPAAGMPELDAGVPNDMAENGSDPYHIEEPDAVEMDFDLEIIERSDQTEDFQEADDLTFEPMVITRGFSESDDSDLDFDESLEDPIER